MVLTLRKRQETNNSCPQQPQYPNTLCNGGVIMLLTKIFLANVGPSQVSVMQHNLTCMIMSDLKVQTQSHLPLFD